MLKRLITAIARIITRTTQPTVGIPVPPTQPVGHASQEPTQPRGNKRSAQTTKPRPVKPAVKAKSVRVLRATTAQSQAPEQVPAQQQQELQSGARGRKQATPASQPVSKSRTRKRSVAQQTTPAASRKPASKPAQTTSGKRGRPRKTPAQRIRQHVRHQAKLKHSAVQRVIQGAQFRLEHQLVRIRTANQCSEFGRLHQILAKKQRPIQPILCRL